MTTLHGLGKRPLVLAVEPTNLLTYQAADNALEFEVITASGEYKTCNAKSNPGLFWALKGGGGGTFAVVLSATIRTFPEKRSSGAEFFINATHTEDPDVFWEGFRIFHKHSKHFVDSGLYTYFEVGGGVLRAKPFVAIDQSKEELEKVLAPMVKDLKKGKVPYELRLFEYDSLHDLYVDLFEPEGAGAFAINGGWMFTRKDVETNNDAIVEAVKVQISPRPDLKNAGYIIGHLWNAGHKVPQRNSATHQAFRDGCDFMITTLIVPSNATLAEKKGYEDLVTDVMDPALRKAGPNGCTYVNEADPFQDDWQERFWGNDIYPELKKTKEKLDPSGLFYAVSMPGTEEWEVIEYGTRLCKRM